MVVTTRQLRRHAICGFFALSSALAASSSGAQQPVPPTIAAYYNPSTQTQYVIYADVNAALWVLTYNNSTHQGWNATQLTQGNVTYQYAPGSPLLAYADGAGQGRMFFLAPDSYNSELLDLYEMRGNPPMCYGNSPPCTVTPFKVTSGPMYPHAYPISNPNTFAYQSSTGFFFSTNSVAWGTNLVGYDDGTNVHAFYFGYTNYFGQPDGLYESYNSHSSDTNWQNHQIVSIPQSANNMPVGLTALWDGSEQHVYWNTQAGLLKDTYYFNSQWQTAQPCCSDSYVAAPYYSVAAASPTLSSADYNWVWGAAWNLQTLGQPGVVAQFNNYATGAYTLGTGTAPNLGLNSGMVAYVWEDNTYGLSNQGEDGGIFYIGTDNAVHAYSPLLGNTLLAYGATTNRNFAPIQNQIAGYWDYSYMHVFFVTSAGQIAELYAPSSSLGPNWGSSWSYHTIGNVTNAAH